MTKAKWGVRVQYCGHDGWFIADVYWTEGAVTIIAPEPVTSSNIHRPATGASYHLVDLPDPAVWMPNRGLFVVPQSQFRRIRQQRLKGTSQAASIITR